MAEKTIEEMKAELAAENWMLLTNYDSGYYVHWEHDNKDTIAHVEYGNMLIEDRDYLRHADNLPTYREAQDESTCIAYAHLQAQRELAALRVFVKEVADAKYTIEYGQLVVDARQNKAIALLKEFGQGESDST